MENENDVMTASEIKSFLSADTDRLTKAERDLSEARSAYSRMVSMVGEEGARERYEASLRDRERETAAITDVVERNARQAIAALEAAQQPALEPEEMRAASAAATFVKEDCADLNLPALRDRIRAFVVAGDRASMWLFARYVPLRDLNAGDGTPGETAAAREIQELLVKINAELRDKRHDEPLNDARALLGKAIDLRSAATAAQRQQAAEDLLERIALRTRTPRSAWVTIPDTAA